LVGTQRADDSSGFYSTRFLELSYEKDITSSDDKRHFRNISRATIGSSSGSSGKQRHFGYQSAGYGQRRNRA
jgi:hypothetical protein